jgi:alkylated DNA repair protein (DNA oxidative demethylase)
MTYHQGFRFFSGYFDRAAQVALLAAVRDIVADAPLYVPTMPHTGKAMSVRMTNAGALGWVTDRDSGYRYERLHPVTGNAWPAIPAMLVCLWRNVADYPAFPEACLVNVYDSKSRLGSHVDADEHDRNAPVVSVSLGDDAVFHIGGSRRSDPKTRMVLRSGDVVVLGGEARLAYHGVDRVRAGTSDLIEGGGRINLTLRRVTVAS